jgi:hypothetical protein
MMNIGDGRKSGGGWTISELSNEKIYLFPLQLFQKFTKTLRPRTEKTTA